MRRTNKNEKDVLYILDNLRDADRMELQEIWGEDWKSQTLENIMKTDFQVLIGKAGKNDVPVVMGGAWAADPNDPGAACVWLLSTDEVKNNQIGLLKQLRREIKFYDTKYWITYNKIHKNNEMAKNWLKWLGYCFDIPNPPGIVIPANFEFFYRKRNPKGLGG